MAEGQVAETRRQPLGVIVSQHLLVRALVKSERFREPILPVINISNVDFQPSQPASVPLPPENCTRLLPGGESLIVPAQQQQRLNGPAQSPRQFCFFASLLKQGDGLLVQMNGFS